MKPRTAAALERWREDWAARVPAVPSATPPPGTGGNPQKSAIVPAVPTVPAENTNAEDARRAAWAAWAADFVRDAAAALAGREPDPIEAAEREAVAAEGAGALGRVLPPAEHQAALAGFLGAGRMGPSWRI